MDTDCSVEGHEKTGIKPMQENSRIKPDLDACLMCSDKVSVPQHSRSTVSKREVNIIPRYPGMTAVAWVPFRKLRSQLINFKSALMINRSIAVDYSYGLAKSLGS